MLLYAAMMAAQEDIAMAHATAMEEELLSLSPSFWDEMADFLDAFIPMRWHVMVRFGRWDQILAASSSGSSSSSSSSSLHYDPSEHVVAHTTMAYARGIAFGVKGLLPEAREELAKVDAVLADPIASGIESRTLFNNKCVCALRVAREMLDGEILYRQALTLLTSSSPSSSLSSVSSSSSSVFEPAWAKLRLAVDLNDGRVVEDDEKGATKNVSQPVSILHALHVE
jgi:hypothetical protein